jgi:hypothetical protein
VPGMRDPCLLLIGGQPAVGSTYSQLSYARAADAGGDWPDSWSGAGSIYVYDVAPYATDASMAVVAGTPAITYLSLNPVALRYVRAMDPEGAGWNSPLELVALTSVAALPSALIELAGKPGVFYNDPGTNQLVFLRGNDAASFAPEPLEVIDSQASSFAACVAGGVPGVAYAHGSLLLYAAYF